jgi:hypothetical protein
MNGQKLKESGQQLALFNAGQVWLDQTIENMKTFCKVRKEIGRPEFRFEEFRKVANERGWPLPSTHKAWGSLPRVAVKHGLIRPTGRYAKATSAATHAHPVAIWSVL